MFSFDITGKLDKLEKWFEKQTIVSMFTSSLIFSADCSRPANNPHVKVKIVDLPYFYPLQHIGAEGYLRGVKNLRRLWADACTKLETDGLAKA